MSRKNNTDTVGLSSSSVEKLSHVLCMIKDIEQKTKSIVFQDSIATLDFGGTSTNILLPTNSSHQIISKVDLDNLKLEVKSLKVN
jgi:hypothetical protein